MADESLPGRQQGRFVPDSPIEDGVIEGEGWTLLINGDGWHLTEADQPARRITVDEAVRKAGHRYARGQIFSRTRKFIAHVARELADEAYIDPVGGANEAARARDLDPKHSAAQMAQAGDDIARLSRELDQAEAAPLP